MYDVVIAVLAGAALGLVGLTLRTWTAMLLLGAAHADIDQRIPPLGFWQSLILVALISALIPIGYGRRKEST